MNARALGVEFARCASFTLPDSIICGGVRRQLYLPQENGLRVAFIDILLDDCYGIKKVTVPVRRIMDIGANVGLFSLFARTIFPETLIHSYEPNPRLEQYLKVQAGSANFTYFLEAVGLNDGKVSLDINEEDSVLSRSSEDERGAIPKVAFSKAVERIGGEVDLLKLDCEGAEWEIFEDASAWGAVRNLTMEYHLWPDHTHDEAQEIVRRLGFKITKLVPIADYGLLIAAK